MNTYLFVVNTMEMVSALLDLLTNHVTKRSQIWVQLCETGDCTQYSVHACDIRTLTRTPDWKWRTRDGLTPMEFYVDKKGVLIATPGELCTHPPCSRYHDHAIGECCNCRDWDTLEPEHCPNCKLLAHNGPCI